VEIDQLGREKRKWFYGQCSQDGFTDQERFSGIKVVVPAGCCVWIYLGFGLSLAKLFPLGADLSFIWVFSFGRLALMSLHGSCLFIDAGRCTISLSVQPKRRACTSY
jgi:hypothetical protein